MLEEIRQVNKKIKFYQASTSELYGNGHKHLQNEDTYFRPSSPYAASKLYGYWITRIYREGYGIFATNGILFNHESPLRGLEFITRKVSNAVAKISLGIDKELRIGNMKAKRDWGYASEYIESMWLMLQQTDPDDFVIATGQTHSVEELVEEAFNVVNLKHSKYVKVDRMFMRPLDVDLLCGDCSKAKKVLHWQPKTKFKELVKIMVEADINRWERCLKGEHFPWDAATYPHENKILSREYKRDR